MVDDMKNSSPPTTTSKTTARPGKALNQGGWGCLTRNRTRGQRGQARTRRKRGGDDGAQRRRTTPERPGDGEAVTPALEKRGQTLLPGFAFGSPIICQQILSREKCRSQKNEERG